LVQRFGLGKAEFICFWPIPDLIVENMLAFLKQILARVTIYSFASLLFTFTTKAKIDLYILHSKPEEAIRQFVDKIPNGSLFFCVWGITFLVAFIPGTLYEIYLRKKNIEK